MPDRKRETKTESPHARPTLDDVEKRLEALERRVAILEAKQLNSGRTLGLNEPAPVNRPRGYELSSEADHVHDLEKPDV